jgi:hypothetical protein
VTIWSNPLFSKNYWPRILPLLLLLFAGSHPSFGAVQITGPITVQQLESFVASVRGKPDAEVASEIAGMELTERLSAVRFARCQANLPGPRAKTALLVLADRSAILDSPADEILAKEEPDLATQKKMIALTVDYVNNTMHRLPNLSATRITTTFERVSTSHNPIHPVAKSSVVILYRDGQEQVRLHGLYKAVGLTTSGEFGPILNTALLDSVHGNLKWSHWQQGTAGPEAVFRYSIGWQKSHYKVDGETTAYTGEIAIDPFSGAILRIVFRTDLDPNNPLGTFSPLSRTADISVEFGPVELGGKTYICPLKGVALSNRMDLTSPMQADVIWLNDRVFENYHLFRSDVRIVPDFSEVH